ncbi:hypothetical protein K7X08_029538 [Anisodus acutangulus]|uniref:Uncharacterized protein n=1 Tax=Anisodus acutangulus TaxID=402998 RepID=A0A9Q1QUV1_9SOLA|nr:hypothetical protein K7X08_029538 [Anisodus acutangulus]
MHYLLQLLPPLLPGYVSSNAHSTPNVPQAAPSASTVSQAAPSATIVLSAADPFALNRVNFLSFAMKAEKTDKQVAQVMRELKTFVELQSKDRATLDDLAPSLQMDLSTLIPVKCLLGDDSPPRDRGKRKWPEVDSDDDELTSTLSIDAAPQTAQAEEKFMKKAIRQSQFDTHFIGASSSTTVIEDTLLIPSVTPTRTTTDIDAEMTRLVDPATDVAVSPFEVETPRDNQSA